MDKLIGISELSKILNLVNEKTKKPSNHILRYWEKEFRQIKPTILKKRRYYSKNQIKIIKFIMFLLKDKGMTINGAKNVLKTNINSLDGNDSFSLKADYQRDLIKNKSINILKKIKKIKNGKKNTS